MTEQNESAPGGKPGRSLKSRLAALFSPSLETPPPAAEATPDEEPASALLPAPLPAAGALLRLYEAWKGELPDEAWEPGFFFLNSAAPSQEEKRALDQFRQEAEQYLTPAPDGAEESSAPSCGIPVDATYSLRLSDDRLSAWLFLFPPLGGGADLTRDDVDSALKGGGVVFGTDEALLDTMAKDHIYMKMALVARGRLPVDGVDGYVIDRVPRTKEISFTENADGSVNFKETNLIDHIAAGDTICEIVAAVPPQDGRDVEGTTLPGREGQPPTVPMGRHTRLNSEKTALISEIDGQISFAAGKFNVESVLTVPGNVDAATGNMDVIGSVVIGGDVLEGYTVKATADITIRGIAEGCTLIAGGNVTLYRGINGNQRGVIQAGGSVTAKFLENCTVDATGSIRSESIINCTVVSQGQVLANQGRGVLIGGEITACQGVEARIIGTNSHRATSIVVGSTPDFLQSLAETSLAVEDMSRELEQLERNITYLRGLDALSPAQTAKYNQNKLRRSVLRIQHGRRAQELEEMDRRLAGMKSCYVKAQTIFPGVKVSIGLETRHITSIEQSCRLYLGADGITLGAV